MENSIKSYIEKATPEQLQEIEKLIFSRKIEIKKQFLKDNPYIEGVKIRLRKTYGINNGKKYDIYRYECTINHKSIYLGNVPDLEKFKQKILKNKKF